MTDGAVDPHVNLVKPDEANLDTPHLKSTPASNAKSGFFFITVAVAGYSCLPIFTEILLNAGLKPLDIAFWRYALAAPLLWLFVWFIGRGAKPIEPGQRLPRKMLFLMGVLLAVAALTAFFGLELIPAGTFVVIFYTYPAIVALIMLFLGERMSGWGWFAVLLTLVGVGLTAPDFSAGLTGDNFTGVMLALFNALINAVYFILSGYILRGKTRLIAASAFVCTGALITLAAIALFNGVQLPPTASAWLALLGLAVISTILPVFSVNRGIQLLGASRAAVVGSFEPLLAALLAMIFLNQTMLPIQWAGGIVIVSSVIILQTLGSRQPIAPVTSITAGE
ncbi:MAG: DMT family transporter [Anaerolineae bacterium]|nr:DMT family transporter [Anaerolineae bacterium]